MFKANKWSSMSGSVLRLLLVLLYSGLPIWQYAHGMTCGKVPIADGPGWQGQGQIEAESKSATQGLVAEEWNKAYDSWVKAIQEGNIEEIRRLLEAGLDMAAADSVDPRNPTVFRAVQSGRGEITEALLEAKANPNIVCKNGNTALDTAVLARRPDLVRALVAAKADPNLSHTLVEASSNGLTDIVRILLESKAQTEKADPKWDATPLAWAAEFGQVDAVDLLLERGADPNAPVSKDHGRTPIYYAMTKGHTPVVRRLLESKRLNFDEIDETKISAFAFADQIKRPDYETLIIEAWARRFMYFLKTEPGLDEEVVREQLVRFQRFGRSPKKTDALFSLAEKLIETAKDKDALSALHHEAARLVYEEILKEPNSPHAAKAHDRLFQHYRLNYQSLETMSQLPPASASEGPCEHEKALGHFYKSDWNADSTETAQLYMRALACNAGGLERQSEDFKVRLAKDAPEQTVVDLIRLVALFDKENKDLRKKLEDAKGASASAGSSNP